jgi:hypothetical protein
VQPRRVIETSDGEQITLAHAERLCARLRAEGATGTMPLWAIASRRGHVWALYGMLHPADLTPGRAARPGEGTHRLVRDATGMLGWAWQPGTAAPQWQPEHRD